MKNVKIFSAIFALGLAFIGIQAQTNGYSPSDSVEAKLKLETATEVATAYTIIFDTSGSMKGDRIRMAKEAFRSWLSSVKEGNVWALYRFRASGGEGQLIVPFTPSGENRVASEIALFTDGGNTPIVATLDLAQSQIEARKAKKPYERHVVVLFTDGDETQDKRGNNGVIQKIRKLRSQNIEVVAIGYAGAGDYMAQAASRYFAAGDHTGLKAGLSQVEVEIDPLTPVSITDQELKELAGPSAPKAVVEPATIPSSPPEIPGSPAEPANPRSGFSRTMLLVAGCFVGFIVLVAVIKSR